jgi:molybdopterin converting factor small subunit
MSTDAAVPAADETPAITVRLWAAARAAAGRGELAVPTAGNLTLRELRSRLSSEYGDRLAAVVTTCSVLVDEQPVSSRDPDEVAVAPGQVVDFLPPFAGG